MPSPARKVRSSSTPASSSPVNPLPAPAPAPRPLTPAEQDAAAAEFLPAVPLESERAEPTDAERLERLLEQFGNVDGFTVKLERVKSPGVPSELCGHLPALPLTSDDFLEDVRQEYGGGKYRGRVYDRRGEYRVGFTFTIAGAARAPRESGPAGLVGVGPGSAALTPADARMERLERSLEKLAELLAVQHEAALAARRPADDDLDRLVKMAKAMRELTPAAPAASSPVASLRELLELRELLDGLGGGGGPSDMAALVEGGVKPITQLMTRSLDLQEKQLMARRERERRTAGAVQPPAPPAPSQPARAVPAPRVLEFPADAVRVSAPDDFAERVRALLADVPTFARMYLATQARLDRDPSAYAVVVLDNIQASSQAAYVQLEELLERPEFLDVMLECVPEWAQSRAWFGELLEEMRATLADDGQEPELDAPAAAELEREELAEREEREEREDATGEQLQELEREELEGDTPA